MTISLEAVTCQYMVVDESDRDGVPYQTVVRCGNGYGASIVRGPYTYGGPEGFFELAVIKFKSEGPEWGITYETPVTSDVIGWLTEEAVAETIDAIAALPGSAE